WESVLQEYDSRTDRGIERTQASRPPSGGVGHMLLPAGNANRKSGLGAPREAQFQGFPEAPRLDLGALPALSCAHSRAGEPDCRSAAAHGPATGAGLKAKVWQRNTGTAGADMQQPTIRPRTRIAALASAFVVSALIGAPTVATADEGGVSFWIPG